MKKRILVVDDEPGLRRLITEVMKAKGYETIEAASGEEALMLLESEEVNIVLLDLKMPKMDGMTFLRIVRRNPDYKHIPVILLTSRSERYNVRLAAGRGVQGYLLKADMSIDQIIMKVEYCLSKAPGSG